MTGSLFGFARGQAGPLSNFVHSPAFFPLLRFARVEHHSVARLEWSLEMNEHAVAPHTGHLAQIYAALFPEPRMNKSLVVDALQPAGVEAARESHLHVVVRSVSERADSRSVEG